MFHILNRDNLNEVNHVRNSHTNTERAFVYAIDDLEGMIQIVFCSINVAFEGVSIAGGFTFVVGA
jgi:hypothetical protein